VVSIIVTGSICIPTVIVGILLLRHGIKKFQEDNFSNWEVGIPCIVICIVTAAITFFVMVGYNTSSIIQWTLNPEYLFVDRFF